MQNTRHDIRVYLQPAFLICVAVLAVAGGSMSIAIKSLGIYLKKEPWPLKKSLDLLDEGELAPYKAVSKFKIEDEQIIKELGTKDYIQWILEDVEVGTNSAIRKCLLFITYYDLPDRVPHVPEKCYAGTGYQTRASNNITFKINKNDFERSIPGKHVVFEGTQGASFSNWHMDTTKFSTFYFFSVNGDYNNDRDKVRFSLNKNIFSKHSYFSKVEWNFLTISGEKTYLDEEEAITAGQKLLSVILPILEKEHWPSEQKVESDE